MITGFLYNGGEYTPPVCLSQTRPEQTRAGFLLPKIRIAMTWPQIGEYAENGKTVRVFKPAYAQFGLELESLWMPKRDLQRIKNGKPVMATGIKESATKQLNF